MKTRTLIAVLCSLLLVVSLASSPSSAEPRQSSPQTAQAPPVGDELGARVTLHAMTLANNIDEVAGERVRILSARVVAVFDPHAFVIESTIYKMHLGFRDRVLVLLDVGSLRGSSDVLVGSTVTILGVARTLLGARVSPGVRWPQGVDRHLIEHHKIRAAVVATSVQTPEGNDLIEPIGRAPGSR